MERHQCVGQPGFACDDRCLVLCDANGDSGGAAGNGDGNHESVVAHDVANETDFSGNVDT